MTKENFNDLNRGDYLGNLIFNSIVKDCKEKELLQINALKMFAFPEKILIKKNIKAQLKYQRFYFSKGNPKKIIDKIIDNSKGIIMIHNSWTPDKYRKMSKKDFLKQDILLAHLLRKIIRKKYE